MNKENFFWLHIKKSAGTSIRKTLKPHYVEVERLNTPVNFIQSHPNQYNDILNNYRVVLGEYQFKRALFAKKYLFDNNTWSKTFSFAFSREPIDRCLSMFYYLHYNKKNFFNQSQTILKNLRNNKKIGFSISYEFDQFLDLVYESHFNSNSIFKPVNLHFSTHTAPMFNDVTDEKGVVILDRIFRLENLKKGIEEVYKTCNITSKIDLNKINNNTKKRNFIPNQSQIKKIYELYKDDFDLYENSI